MKYFVCIFALFAILGMASAGYIRSGWSRPYSHSYYRPVVSRVVYSPSYGHGYGGHGGYGGYGGYGGHGGYGGYGHGGYGGWSSGYRSGWW